MGVEKPRRQIMHLWYEFFFYFVSLVKFLNYKKKKRLPAGETCEKYDRPTTYVAVDPNDTQNMINVITSILERIQTQLCE